MQTRVDRTLRLEARRYELRFTCEHCVHFAARIGDATPGDTQRTLQDEARGRCSLGYPIDPHHEIDLERVESIAFCKEFELD